MGTTLTAAAVATVACAPPAQAATVAAPPGFTPDPSFWAGDPPVEHLKIQVQPDHSERIDLFRAHHQECSGSGDDQECETVGNAYSDVAVHLVGGVSLDLNNNLYFDVATGYGQNWLPDLGKSYPDTTRVDIQPVKLLFPNGTSVTNEGRDVRVHPALSPVSTKIHRGASFDHSWAEHTVFDSTVRVEGDTVSTEHFTPWANVEMKGSTNPEGDRYVETDTKVPWLQGSMVEDRDSNHFQTNTSLLGSQVEYTFNPPGLH